MHQPNGLLPALNRPSASVGHIFYSHSPKWLQPSQVKVHTAPQNECTKQVRKVRPLVKVALLLSAAHCTFITTDLKPQRFRLGPLQLASPAPFGSQKDLGQTLCGPWIMTRNYYEVYLPQLRTTQNTKSLVYGLFAGAAGICCTNTDRSVVLELLPAFQTSYTLNKDNFPLLTAPLCGKVQL